METTRRIFLQGVMATAVGLALGAREIEASPKKYDNLNDYLIDIAPVKMACLKVVEENDIFAGFKEIDREDRIFAFNKYFSIYYAGQLQYEVPWELLFITHAHETTLSTDQRPDRLTSRGAMQRTPQLFPDTTPIKAATGWEFLEGMDELYPAKIYSKYPDYREILFAAEKLQKDSKTSEGYNWLRAMKRYCREDFAIERIDQYNKIKGLFLNAKIQSPKKYFRDTGKQE